MDKIDVTDNFEFDLNDDENLPVTRCICGQRYALWEFQLNYGKDSISECETCHRKFYFVTSIRIYEVVDK